jgi:hypothetical protein
VQHDGTLGGSTGSSDFHSIEGPARPLVNTQRPGLQLFICYGATVQLVHAERTQHILHLSYLSMTSTNEAVTVPAFEALERIDCVVPQLTAAI